MKRANIPPLGAVPKVVRDAQNKEKRIIELSEAIERFLAAHWPIPIEQVLEYNELVETLPREGER